jgi:hypothetical protein
MRYVHGSLVLVSAMVFGVVVACGGSKPPPESAEPAPAAADQATDMGPTETSEPPAETAAPSASETAEAPPAKPSWDEMSKEQRTELMKTVVQPKMAELLKEFDAKRFADVKCTTCHGPGVKQGKFDMPNPKLPKLDPKDKFAKHKKKSEKILAFMMEKVVPEMASLIGEQPFDPETKKGFGCGNCHMMVGMPAKVAPAKAEPSKAPAKK